MKKLWIFVSALLVTACCDQKSVDSAPQVFNYSPNFQEIKVDAGRLDRIDALLQDYVDKGILPHALTFVAKSGQVIHNKAFGWRDVEKKIPLQKDDIFRMYSQTKAITTVALMTLFEESKFQLDDPVSKYIPEMTDRVLVNPANRKDTTTRKAVTPVKIRHVLSHTAGISVARDFRNGQPFETLADYVKVLVAAPLIYDPGTDWNYHPSSDVWARLVEVISGQDLQTYVAEHVLKPLGIKDMAYYYPDTTYKSRFVTIYREEQGKIVPVEMWSGRDPFGEDKRFANGGTGLSGTIEGYARFCQMVLNGGSFNQQRVLGRRTIEIMAKDQVAHPGRQADNFHFGIGFQIYPADNGYWNAQNQFSPMVSGGALSWGGMANTDYIIDPKEDMIILLYTNRLPDTLVWEKFLNTVYQALE